MIPEKKHPDYVEYPEIGGEYEHYKGGRYEVITLAKHTETEEVMVVYKSLIFGSVHARPLGLWFEDVQIPNTKKSVKRFTLIEY